MFMENLQFDDLKPRNCRLVVIFLLQRDLANLVSQSKKQERGIQMF